MIRAIVLAATFFTATACSAQDRVVEPDADSHVDVSASVANQVDVIKPKQAYLRPKIAPQGAGPAEMRGAPIEADVQDFERIERTILDCQGVAKQGGALLCQTTPLAKVKIGRSTTQADENGKVIIGFDRDASVESKVVVTHASGEIVTHPISVEARKYVEQRIDGLPPSQVSEYSAADLKRIRSSSARKKIGFASNQPEVYFKDGFDYPIKDFVKTSPFGSRRILNGEPKSPHYGVDIAAPLGTPIYAPAAGVVGLADEDLYFEGAMVMIDHGQGLNSLYLHVNDVFVKPGDIVARGDLIAEVGSKGRSTGPHLCWRLKWKRENLDPELLTQWPGR